MKDEFKFGFAPFRDEHGAKGTIKYRWISGGQQEGEFQNTRDSCEHDWIVTGSDARQGGSDLPFGRVYHYREYVMCLKCGWCEYRGPKRYLGDLKDAT